MKFCKKYKEYVQGQKQELPWVGFKNLKTILSQCREECECHQEVDDSSPDRHSCSLHCPVCDGTFFPSLLEEMSAVVGCFNKRAQKLLQLHLASGFKKYLLWFKGERDHASLMQEGKDLVTYAVINSVAFRKILKKYDKLHYSTQGQAFRSKAQSIHIEILQSPWLCELMSFHINIRQQHINPKNTPSALFEGSSLVFDDENKPSLSCELFDSVKFDIDLTCSICLDTVFDPVSLKCGHIFCYMCTCSAASITIVDGLEAAAPREKCPLCREAGVFEGAVRLDELSILLSRSCPEYWEKRLQLERKERIRQAKQHWENQCQAFLGV